LEDSTQRRVRPRNPEFGAGGRNLTHSIAQDLGRAIVTGVYSEGRPFPYESELCAQYDASRPVLREAVKMITAKGLLSARPRQGTWVQPEDRWNLLDPDVLAWLLERRPDTGLLVEFTELRLAIEPEAAALAALVAGEAEQAALRDAVARMQAAELGQDDPLTSDIAFHVAILRGSRNRFFAQLTEFVETALRISIRWTNRQKGVPQANVKDHVAVAKAILARDAALAQARHRGLIQGALDLMRAEDR
jgi:DNA-binding FadR family transcriptional regulator